jgi:hypothetical protein
VAAQRRRRDPRRPQRLGARGDLEPRDQRLRPVLGDKRASRRQDEAPHLLRPHQRLPLHHHPADLHRPPRHPGVSPADDAQFRLRPGLAGSGTVSFESVNYPGYFLRHANYDFQLAHNDGSSQFAADASFRQVAGLADSTWSSFQSYNHPDRYIRHYAYQLRLDPITTATGRGDATFRVTN